MANLLYNEGRVVGYSAYEIYVKNTVANSGTPVSEREWLTASLAANGCSMIYEVKADETKSNTYIDIALPSGSNLCAANLIIGSLFLGECTVDDTGWATSVTDYGKLIYNNSTSHPETNEGVSTVPGNTTAGYSTDEYAKIHEYLKIVEGITYQEGTWTKNTISTEPYMDFSPDLTKSGYIRISFRGTITKNFYVMFTGFTDKVILNGETGIESSIAHGDYINGGLLGPGTFPWSNKIVFSVLPYMLNTLSDKYTRSIPKTIGNAVNTDYKTTSDGFIFDTEEYSLNKYYTEYTSDSSSVIPITISNLESITDNTDVLITYSNILAYDPNEAEENQVYTPAALYGLKVSKDDISTSTTQNIYPIDTVAPGTIKLFSGTIDASSTDRDSVYNKALSLETYIPNNYAVMRSTEGVWYQFINDEITPVAEGKESTKAVEGYLGDIAPYAELDAGTKVTYTLRMTNDDELYSLSGEDGEISTQTTGAVTWYELIYGLQNDKSINVLSTSLKGINTAMNDILDLSEHTGTYLIAFDDDKNITLSKYSESVTPADIDKLKAYIDKQIYFTDGDLDDTSKAKLSVNSDGDTFTTDIKTISDYLIKRNSQSLFEISSSSAQCRIYLPTTVNNAVWVTNSDSESMNSEVRCDNYKAATLYNNVAPTLINYEGVKSSGSLTKSTMGIASSGIDVMVCYASATYLSGTLHVTGGDTSLSKNLYVGGNLTVSGTKQRVVETENHGIRGLYAYETAEPYFGDIGTATIGENGSVKISVEEIFGATTDRDYIVFLQPIGKNPVYITAETSEYFQVDGVAGTKFHYEVKAHQLNCSNIRLEEYTK